MKNRDTEYQQSHYTTSEDNPAVPALSQSDLTTINPNEEKNDIHIKLEILSPLDKKDDVRVEKYLNHIKDAVDSEDVKNLALSGVYGSGKSTIIKSFKSKYPDLKVLQISLASFNEEIKYEDFKEQIQLNILQQIIYSQKADKLPESRINRISEIDTWSKSNRKSVLSFLGLLISLYTLLSYYKFQLNPNNWYISKNIKNIISDISWGFLVFVTVFSLSVFYAGQLLIKTFVNSKINKISLSGEAELENKNDNKDVLNKYIDEIIYFFEKVPIDIVVIEDLDRFNTTEIYRTLREVNFILNTYIENLKSENLKKVTFLYAIKDDLFLSELDRTKFFDLIIPAIPFVNYSNSKNVLNSKLDEIFKNDKIFEKPSKEFINTVSTFITDNRTLLNIINEFIVYKEQQKLETEELNPEKLLALIIYKNLRPKDFSRLHTCKSNIDVIINNKRELIEKCTKEFEDKIKEKEKEITKIKNSNIKNIKELNTIFLFHIKEKINSINAKGLIYKNTNKVFHQIIDESLDLKEYYNDKIRWFSNPGTVTSYNVNITLEEVDDIVGYSYESKYDLIINKDSEILEIENEIKKIRQELSIYDNKTLAEILKSKDDLSKDKLKEDFASFYSQSDIQENERAYNDSLLIFLLENGYIDEHYREYISTFQKGGLNETDHEFKINIISKIHDPKPIDYKLNDIDDIVNELPINYFQDSRILNIQMLDFLIANRNEYKEKLNSTFNVISAWNNRRIKEFLISYLKNSENKKLFINEISQSWQDLWVKTSSDSQLIDEDKKLIIFTLLIYGNDKSISILNKNNSINDYLRNYLDVLLSFEKTEFIDRIKEIFDKKILHTKYESIVTLKQLYPNVYEILYYNNMYEKNINCITDILNNEVENFDFSEFANRNFSYILESNIEPLIKYIVEDDYDSYIKNIYSDLENESQRENEEFILKILNNEKLSLDNKAIFIEKQSNRVSNITELKTTALYDLALSKNKIEANWDNVYQYYYEKDCVFNDELNLFLNIEENYLVLAEEKITDSSIESDFQNQFIFALISNDSLTNISYENIVTHSISKDFSLSEDFDYSTISKDKVEILIKTNAMVTLTEPNFEQIKAVHPNLHIKLLLRSWNEYLSYCEEYEIDVEDKILILGEGNLNDDLKLTVIKNQISINDLKNRNLVIDIVHLILNSRSPLNKSEIINPEKLKVILAHALVTENKIKLINLLSDKISKDDILEVQGFLPEYYQVYPKSQLMLSNNDVNKQYIKLLQNIKIAGEAKTTKNNEIRVWLNDYTK